MVLLVRNLNVVCTIDDIIILSPVSPVFKIVFSEFDLYFAEREIDTLSIVLHIDYACLELFSRLYKAHVLMHTRQAIILFVKTDDGIYVFGMLCIEIVIA